MSLHKVCKFCVETVKICAPAFERKCAADIFFNVEGCVAASINISCFFKERAAGFKRHQEKCATGSEYIFYAEGCAAASEKISRKICSCFYTYFF